MQSDSKPTNPKDALGIRKVPASTISAPVKLELGLAMMEGALKYGRHNYRDIGVRASVYYDALTRHIDSWWEGEDTDEPFWLESLDQLAFQAMLWGFANVLWRPQSCRPWLLLAKAGFCFQMALGTGGQSFDAILPRSAAILFMWIAMWHLLSRLGIGTLEGSSDASELPP